MVGKTAVNSSRSSLHLLKKKKKGSVPVTGFVQVMENLESHGI